MWQSHSNVSLFLKQCFVGKTEITSPLFKRFATTRFRTKPGMTHFLSLRDNLLTWQSHSNVSLFLKQCLLLGQGLLCRLRLRAMTIRLSLHNVIHAKEKSAMTKKGQRCHSGKNKGDCRVSRWALLSRNDDETVGSE